MKSCPTCDRTFEDTFTFCLVDGSILSAPYDSEATQGIPTPQNTNSDLTEVVSPTSRPSDPTSALYPTIPTPPPRPLYSENQPDHSHAKQTKKIWLLSCIGVLLVGIFAVMITVSFMRFDNDNAVSNQSTSNIQNNNAISDQESKPYPAKCTLAGRWSNRVEGLGPSTWTISADGKAVESGLGDVTGTAMLSGNKLTIRWEKDEYAGVYEWSLGTDCTSGTGTLTWTRYPDDESQGPTFKTSVTRVN